tara:strand:+ start:2026 stop:3282 length:1257 start_codon:yes stop_codon:yes gene_type:complete
MGGGLMQLVAYGAQDVYLTGNPQITFFKVVYRRHTNFSMESIEQTFNGTVDFGKKVSATISRNGDLVGPMYLQVTIPAIAASSYNYIWNHYVGLNLINNVEIEIGGQRIDKHYSHWMYIWSELTVSAGKADGFKQIVGEVPASLQTLHTAAAQTTLHVPLQFWFCRNPGLALPLIALQYHEVKCNIEFESFANCIRGHGAGDTDSKGGAYATTPTLVGGSLWVDYIYLDTDERRRFAQVSHEYLIEQLQFAGDESVTGQTTKVRLNFNHPVKELVWVVRKDANTSTSSNASSFFNYGDAAATNSTVSSVSGGDNVVSGSKLQLNGHDRFAERTGAYFNYVQPFQHHTACPANGINSYSFALKPEEHQPSGTCNFSRIDNATLAVNSGGVSSSATIKVFATNYNVLRVMSGMGGLAYSN